MLGEALQQVGRDVQSLQFGAVPDLSGEFVEVALSEVEILQFRETAYCWR